jgi:hypothetical protein
VEDAPSVYASGVQVLGSLLAPTLFFFAGVERWYSSAALRASVFVNTAPTSNILRDVFLLFHPRSSCSSECLRSFFLLRNPRLGIFIIYFLSSMIYGPIVLSFRPNPPSCVQRVTEIEVRRTLPVPLPVRVDEQPTSQPVASYIIPSVAQ